MKITKEDLLLAQTILLKIRLNGSLSDEDAIFLNDVIRILDQLHRQA